MVDLRGQFSNHEVRKIIDFVGAHLTRSAAVAEVCHASNGRARRPLIRESVDVDELVLRFQGGQTIKDLAIKYAISESSVKRVLRARHTRRR